MGNTITTGPRDRNRVCRICHKPTFYSSKCLRCRNFASQQAAAMGVESKPVKRLTKAPRRSK